MRRMYSIACTVSTQPLLQSSMSSTSSPTASRAARTRDSSPWGDQRPPFGFGSGDGHPWIPQPLDWEAITVEAQTGDPASTLSFYREALATRRTFATPAGDEVEMLDLGEDVLAFRRGPVTVVLNCGAGPVDLPEGEVLMASGPVAGTLPADTAVWLG